MIKSRSRIIRNGEYTILPDKTSIEVPRIFKALEEQELDERERRLKELQEEIARLEQELEERRKEFEAQAEEIIKDAEKKAAEIIENAENGAFERMQKAIEEGNQKIREAEEKAKEILKNAEVEAEQMKQRMMEEARQEIEELKRKAYDEGLDRGFEDGKQELELLIDRARAIVGVLVERRDEILEKTEDQVIRLVLGMVRKIVKYLSENEEKVVIAQVKEALRKIRGALKVIIKVNPQDLNVVSRHKEEFFKLFEQVPEIKIFEDPFVDRGGVVVETDVGTVDARIIAQLEELEEKLLGLAPSSRGLLAEEQESEEKITDEVATAVFKRGLVEEGGKPLEEIEKEVSKMEEVVESSA